MAEPSSATAGGPRRHYRDAACGPVGAGHGVLLDESPALTPLGRPLAVAIEPLARDIAAEWQAQARVIDMETMPLTRIANTAIDKVGAARRGVIAELIKYAGADLVCYRAEAPSGLVEREARHWDPIVDWARQFTGEKPVLACGIVAVDQPVRLLDALSGHADAHDDLELAALAMLSTITGSALIALALSFRAVEAEAAWVAAHVDEDWQIEHWGEDGHVARRRERMRRDFAAAVRVLELSRA
jgi:chaperone required for assembly of F1-ATPase